MTVEWLQHFTADHNNLLLRGLAKEQLPPWMFWTYLGVSIALVAMAGLMSGLTLGLMSLDELDLEVLKRSGTEIEKRHARRIMPVIENEHFLLVTLLLFNALSTEALPIFLDKLVDPVTAVLLSVSVVLVIGEILPQAVCRSYGLQVGSYSALFVRLLMMLSAPVTWPVGKLLDWLLGDEQTALFRRAQLKALVGLHSSAEGLGGNLTADEISIITGALDLTSKTACTAMTPIDKVFMLPSDRRLDEATLQDILVSGHSRLPVHAPGDRRNLLGLILVKELVLVDPEEGLTAGQLVSRSLPCLSADTPLYQLLRLFEAGGSHMVALTRPPLNRASQDGSTSAAAALLVSRPGSASGNAAGGVGVGGMHRIKSGVIKTSGDNMLYIEAEQRAPLSPQGSWGVAPPSSALPSGASTSAAAAGKRDSSGTTTEHGPLLQCIYGPDVQVGDPVGIITIEDVIEELLQQEIIDETDQYVDNLQVTRVDAYNLTTSLPPRLRKAYAQQFTPRVGRLVVHHPSNQHESSGAWKGLTVLKQQQMAPRGAYSNPTTPLAGTPLAGSPDSSALASPMSALAAFGGAHAHMHAQHMHSRLSGEQQLQQQQYYQQQQQQQQHMQQVPEQQQLRLGFGHGPRHAAAHLPTQPHQHTSLTAAAAAAASASGALVRRNSADAVGPAQGFQRVGGAAATAAATDGVAGFSGPHSWGASAAHAPHPVGSGGSTGSGSSLLSRSLIGRLRQQPQPQPSPQPSPSHNNASPPGSKRVVVPGGVGVPSGVSADGCGAVGVSRVAAATGSVAVRGISRAHSGGSSGVAGPALDAGVSAADAGGSMGGADGGNGGGGAGSAGGVFAAGFGSVVEVDELKKPLLDDQEDDSD